MSDWIKVRLKWRYKDQTGTYEDTESKSAWLDDDGNPNYFAWEEGNFSCDCNRATFFGLGEDWPCGEKIEVISIEPLHPSPGHRPGDSQQSPGNHLLVTTHVDTCPDQVKKR